MYDKNIQFREDPLIGSECMAWALLPVINIPKEVVRGEKSCLHTQSSFIFLFILWKLCICGAPARGFDTVMLMVLKFDCPSWHISLQCRWEMLDHISCNVNLKVPVRCIQVVATTLLKCSLWNRFHVQFLVFSTFIRNGWNFSHTKEQIYFRT